MEWSGYRWRAIWSKLYHRPLEETFHEFILNLLRWVLGESWRQIQAAAAPDQQHIVYQWFQSYSAWKKANRSDANRDGNRWAAPSSGHVLALHQLAWDMYCLQIINRLPDFMHEKLRDKAQFQGVRYEIAVAAMIARAGFEITFLDDLVKNKRHCEFIAKHKDTGIQIGVEAKSRRRKGVLNEVGQVPHEGYNKGDVWGLLKKALTQKPENLPYIIFIDVNLPATPQIPWAERQWVKDAQSMLIGIEPQDNARDLHNAVALTNFASYYSGNEEVPPNGEYVLAVTKQPEHPLPGPEVLDGIWHSLSAYPVIPDEV